MTWIVIVALGLIGLVVNAIVGALIWSAFKGGSATIELQIRDVAAIAFIVVLWAVITMGAIGLMWFAIQL